MNYAVSQRHRVEPDPATGIAEVRHDLGTEDILVQCETAAGIAVGYAAAVPIDRDRVEVATVAGSGVEYVRVTPRQGS